MTLKELYYEIGGDYACMLDRLRSEQRIEKFVLLFLKDDSFSRFMQAVNAGCHEEAFRAVHTLKGVCMNLSFDALYRISAAVTEALRNSEQAHAQELIPELAACYEQHIRAISAYEQPAEGRKVTQ